MSLTSFLKSPGITAKCAEFFPFRAQHFSWPMLAPPLSTNPQMIGTAFDYIVRFHLEKWSAPRRFESDWIAEQGLFLLRKSEIHPAAKSRFIAAQQRFAAFLDGAPCDDELLASSLHLAQLDEVFRGHKRGSEPRFDGTVSPVDIADLRACTALLRPEVFRWEAGLQSPFPPLLNPTFGVASGIVGGADADFCLGTTLFEIKTVREAKITAQMHFQLIGYCALHELGSIDDSSETPRRELEEVAIYFSRFGKIARFQVGEIMRSPRFDEFLAWFAPCAGERTGNSPLLPHLRRFKTTAPK